MDQPSIFSATLGLSYPWQMTSINFGTDAKRVDIYIDLAHGCIMICPKCGSEAKISGMEAETWFHSNFFNYAAYLHAKVPRLECCGGISPLERPWSRAGSRFVPLEVAGSA